MYKNLSIIFALLILISCSNNNENTNELKYPESKKIDFTENLHGYEISDSYRWLEDFTSEESIDWIERQNSFTKQFIKKNGDFMTFFVFYFDKLKLLENN